MKTFSMFSFSWLFNIHNLKKMTTQVHSQPARLFSIDALRGFDMLLISGGAVFIELLEGKTGWKWLDIVSGQLHHPEWSGFTFYDFIFPLFLFVSGVSLPFSINKAMASGATKKDIYRRAARRMLILIILGIIDKNTPVTFFDPANIRLASVLGRIGIAGFITTVLYLNFSYAKRVAWIAGILILYYGVLLLVPVPGYGPGDLSIEGNIVGWFDRHFLPGKLLQKIYDENGLLTQFPALCLCIMGSLAGDILRSETRPSYKIKRFIIAGLVCIVSGLLWSLHFPINKKLWTSSFILLTGGMSFMFLFLFYYIIDVLKYKKWAFFFHVIGMNSLFVYLACRFISFSHSANLIFSGIYEPFPERFYPAFDALGGLILVWGVLYFMYKKNIFIKI